MSSIRNNFPKPPQELNCMLGCHLRVTSYALKLKPPKPPKLQSEEGSYLKTEKFVEVLFQKLYEVIAQYSTKIHETFWASH